MKRPALSPDSFLKHLFAPKSNPLPSGIRKRALKGKKGQHKGRLAAYNRMSGASQEILRMSGLRDEYLSGSKNLTDARKTLRGQALSKGYAKPTAKEKAVTVQTKARETHMGTVHYAASKIYRKLNEGRPNSPANYANLVKNLAVLTDDSLVTVSNMEYEELRRAAHDPDMMMMVNGKEHNPLWYH